MTFKVAKTRHKAIKTGTKARRLQESHLCRWNGGRQDKQTSMLCEKNLIFAIWKKFIGVPEGKKDNR